ncbi:SSI family serine proteinase inhibitor [Streptomyces sp. NPDC004111]|uniref:SSI family serine proteinase inhibitor n=1 Tax=Streptomyces sp. NPDC004111 TaxID=3364690 RepID=UPI0036C4287F
MLRRTAVLALPVLALLTSAASASAVAHPAPGAAGRAGDHLTVTLTGTGPSDGAYELFCHPAAGTHPEPQEACDSLDGATVWGKDPFAPVPPDALCTDVYGGPETARVTGVWAGRPVDTDYRRTNGCEIARWDAMRPLLPPTSGMGDGAVR